jgi:hypothetical protein
MGRRGGGMNLQEEIEALQRIRENIQKGPSPRLIKEREKLKEKFIEWVTDLFRRNSFNKLLKRRLYNKVPLVEYHKGESEK